MVRLLRPLAAVLCSAVARGIVLVPYLNEHKVEAYDLRAALK